MYVGVGVGKSCQKRWTQRAGQRAMYRAAHTDTGQPGSAQYNPQLVWCQQPCTDITTIAP